MTSHHSTNVSSIRLWDPLLTTTENVIQLMITLNHTFSSWKSVV